MGIGLPSKEMDERAESDPDDLDEERLELLADLADLAEEMMLLKEAILVFVDAGLEGGSGE